MINAYLAAAIVGIYAGVAIGLCGYFWNKHWQFWLIGSAVFLAYVLGRLV